MSEATQRALLWTTTVVTLSSSISGLSNIVGQGLTFITGLFPQESDAEIMTELHIRELFPEGIPKRSQLIFNSAVKKKIDAVFGKVLENKEHRLAQKSILLTGPAGTGKSSLAMTLVHDGFRVLVLSADQITNIKSMMKLLKLARSRAHFYGEDIVFIIEEAEIFFETLSPAHTNLGPNGRATLEARFLTEFGTNDRSLFIWTSNTLKDLYHEKNEPLFEEDLLDKDVAPAVHSKQQGILRRFRNIIYTPLPDANTRLQIIITALQSRIKKLKLDAHSVIFNEQPLLNLEATDPFFEITQFLSPDDLRTTSDNIVAYAHIVSQKEHAPCEISKEMIVEFFKDEKSISQYMQAVQRTEREVEIAELHRQAKIAELLNKANARPADSEKSTPES